MIKYISEAADGKLFRLDNFAEGCWIDLVNPTDDECDEAVAFSGVGEDMIKAALDEEERARIESDGDARMFIVDCPIIEEGQMGDSYTTLPLAIIQNPRCIITVSLKGNAVLKDFITGRESVPLKDRLRFMLTFMLCNATRFLYCLKQIDRKNHRIQAEMGKTMRNEEIVQLLDLQNSLVYFSTSLSANDRVYEKLIKAENALAIEEYSDLAEDVSIENKQAIETCNIYKNILSVTMDAYGSVISNNSNDSMRRLTIITILLAIPTMIAGFWGMNMPVPFQSGIHFYETGWFWLVIGGAILLTAAIAVILLKRPTFVRPRTVRRRNKKDKRRER